MLFDFGFKQTTIPISISRVNQFDAGRLDIEMTAMLKEQLVKVFSLMKVIFTSFHESVCCTSVKPNYGLFQSFDLFLFHLLGLARNVISI